MMKFTDGLSKRRFANPRMLSFARILIVVIPMFVAMEARAQTFGCNPPMANSIVCENSKPGNPPSEWDISGAGDPSIQGFATDISVNQGQTIRLKINTTASAYRLDIYRMGYYNGMGARKVATILPSAPLPQNQPACLTNSATGLIDCGNWAESASWAVPPNATSGIYFVVLLRLDTGGASHIFFVVRADGGGSALLFKTSDTTWQAYNSYGGNSLYTGSPAGRAYKVSYNRPFNTRGSAGGPSNSWVFNAEYPMVRWLEANGYDVSYFTSVDADRNGSTILGHKVLLSVGHDEYWSAGERANVEAARAAGVHLAFFSGNEVFWKTRWENSIDTSNTPYRTLVCYKETHAGQPIDPLDPPTWTGTWRDPRFSPPADGGRPENALTGTIFYVNGVRNDAITVPAGYGRLRFWRNTSITTLAPGTMAVLPTGTLGYEWDEERDNGFRPAGLVDLSSTTLDVSGYYLLDYGSTYGAGTATHNLNLYRASSGALVFGAGTVQWSWGLDGNHDNGGSLTDLNMQQATINLFADMGVQPATLQPGLVAASASTDTIAPTSRITSPAAGASVQTANPIPITGTASDTGGVVGGVEVSFDGGTTWHRAVGLESWSYTWTPGPLGTVTLKSRAVDDSGNLEVPSAGVTVTVVPDTTPPVISGVQTTAITNAWVTVIWNTNKTADSQVEYGTTTAYGLSTVLDPTLVTNHSVLLGGLTPTTLYHYRVKSRDASGNMAISGDFTFTTTAANSTLTITFDSLPGNTVLSGQYPTGMIDWGNGSWWVSGPWGAFTNNSISFANGAIFSATFTFLTRLRLLSLVAYNGDVVAATVTLGCPGQLDKQVTLASGQLLTIPTGWNDACSPVTIRSTNGWNTNFNNLVVDSPPATPPVISVVQATAITCGGATITWSTDKLATSQVDYGTTSAYGTSTPLDPTLVTSHSVPVTGLTSSTLYHYRVDSKDASGTLATSGDFTFTTVPPSTTPPVISAVQAIAITNSSAYVTWTTNTAANSQVDYGTTTAYGTSTPLNTTLVTNHSVPLSALSANILYHYRVKSKDTCGTLTTSGDFTFTTTNAAPNSIWNSTATPTVASQSDTKAVEVGVKFTSDVAGYIIGVRFYKGPANTGTHIGNLWTNTGTLLASATFTNEAVSGWQHVNFAAPVAITANTTYVASYHTNVGGYADDQGYFSTAGFDNPPLHALANAVSGGNGVFLYGSGGFPTQSFTSSNYWVDVAFAPSLTAPVISAVQATNITSSGATITWTTSTAANSQVEYGTTTAYSSSTTLDPTLVTSHSVGLSGLTANTLYHYRVRSTDGSGNLTVSGDFTFTTAADPPPVITNVQATGITSSGATITWTTDRASDSQVKYGTTTAYGSSTTLNPTLVTSHSVALSGLIANTLYHYQVLSRNSSGGLSTSADFTFTTLPSSTAPPVISGVQAIATTNTSAYISWTTDQASDSEVDYGTTTAYGSSTPVNTSLVTSHTVLLTGLTPTTLYHYRVNSKNSSGSLGTSGDFTFTTNNAAPITIWSNTTTPAVASSTDTAAVELGVKFTSDVSGYIIGLRFYKGSANTGTHVGNLWTSTGTLLASATFTNETASGWQQVNFATPVAITANTVYVASYHTNVGGYAINGAYFYGVGYDNPPLHALRDGVSGGNGVFLYGVSAFPTQSFNQSNYWVDLVFNPSVSISPTSASIQVGLTQQFTSNTNVTWQVNGVTGGDSVHGAISTTGLYTAPTSVPNPATVTVTAVSQADTTKTASATVTITTAPPPPPVSVSISPTSASVQVGLTQQFTATVQNSTNTNVTWQINGVTGGDSVHGAISTTGLYTAPTSVPNPATVTVTAVSQADTTKSASATVTIIASPPVSLWSNTTTPAVASATDTAAVELGVKFTSDVSGYIIGLRFYKGSANTGTHVGNLWTSTGTLLATATFTNETASGWQQVNFATPVAITANTVYVASYHTNVGGYAIDQGYFRGVSFDNPPLHALRDGVSGGNGVFLYGASAFPTQSFNQSNYWVDIVLVPR